MPEFGHHVSEACRLYLAIGFFWAAVHKGIDIRRFSNDLSTSFPWLAGGSLLAAIFIVGLEGLIAVFLLMPATLRHAGALLAITTLSTFTLIMAYSLARGTPVTCSCFGNSSHRVSVFDILRNLLFVVAAAFLLLHPVHDNVLDSISFLATFGLSFTFFLFSIAVPDIAFLLRIRSE